MQRAEGSDGPGQKLSDRTHLTLMGAWRRPGMARLQHPSVHARGGTEGRALPSRAATKRRTLFPTLGSLIYYQIIIPHPQALM